MFGRNWMTRTDIAFIIDIPMMAEIPGRAGSMMALAIIIFGRTSGP
jgi:hypothetical protein